MRKKYVHILILCGLLLLLSWLGYLFLMALPADAPAKITNRSTEKLVGVRFELNGKKIEGRPVPEVVAGRSMSINLPSVSRGRNTLRILADSGGDLSCDFPGVLRTKAGEEMLAAYNCVLLVGVAAQVAMCHWDCIVGYEKGK